MRSDRNLLLFLSPLFFSPSLPPRGSFTDSFFGSGLFFPDLRAALAIRLGGKEIQRVATAVEVWILDLWACSEDAKKAGGRVSFLFRILLSSLLYGNCK